MKKRMTIDSGKRDGLMNTLMELDVPTKGDKGNEVIDIRDNAISRK